MEKEYTIEFFVIVYVVLVVLGIFANFLRQYFIYFGNIKLSREITFQMSFRLMHASVTKFFDRIPLGRILNRFLKDTEVIDTTIPWTFSFFWKSVFDCLLDVVSASISATPLLLVFVAFYAWISLKF